MRSSMFAGTYDDLIREWKQILKKIIGAPNEDLIRLLPLHSQPGQPIISRDR